METEQESHFILKLLIWQNLKTNELPPLKYNINLSKKNFWFLQNQILFYKHKLPAAAEKWLFWTNSVWQQISLI